MVALELKDPLVDLIRRRDLSARRVDVDHHAFETLVLFDVPEDLLEILREESVRMPSSGMTAIC